MPARGDLAFSRKGEGGIQAVKVRFLSSSLDQVPGDILVLFHFEDQLLPHGPLARLDWILNGLVSQLLYLGKFSGGRSQSLLLSTSGKFSAEKALVLGLGRKSDLRWDGLVQAYSYAIWASLKMKLKEIALTIPEGAYSSLSIQAGRDLLHTLVWRWVQAGPSHSDLGILFHEEDPERRHRLGDSLRDALPEVSRKFGVPIQILKAEGDSPCGT